MGKLIRPRRRNRAQRAMDSGSKLNIFDWYVHQGHQYEFFKVGHQFHLAGFKHKAPDWNKEHRPLLDNVTLTTEKNSRDVKFDVVMIRSPIDSKRYRLFIQMGAIPIAVMQTTNHFPLPPECRHVVWNSYDVMQEHKGKYPQKKHTYIVHGYDPEEFVMMDREKNGKVLTVANVFKGRADIMGFPLWNGVRNQVGNLDVIGHGNNDLYSTDRQAKTLEHLIEIYNTYSVYFNPTKSSAMPRSRAEAMMCGMPLVTTNNFDISRYIKHKENGFLSNDKAEISKIIKDLLASEAMREDYGHKARETAIKHFNLKDYLDKWNNLFLSL